MIESNSQKAGNSRTPLLSRFRFHGIETLLAEQTARHRSSKPGHSFHGKIKFRDLPVSDVIACPHCDSGEMNIFRRRLGDESGCCDVCGYGNDVPGVVAEALQLSLRKSVEWLIYQHGLRDTSDDDIERYLKHRSRYEQFVVRLNERLGHSYAPCNPRANHSLDVVELERLLDQLNLLQYVDTDVNIEFSMTGPDGYKNRPGVCMERDIPSNWRSPLKFPSDLFAVEDHRLVETWWSNTCRFDPEKQRFFGNTSPGRLFHGKGWKQVLVIPLQDVPGHFCGALYIGREGKYPDDYRVKLLTDLDSKATNPGFFLPFRNYQAISRIGKNDESRILATTNVLHALRTMLQFRGPIARPPLVGWIDGIESQPEIESTDWSPFRNITNKTFWLQRFDPVPMRTIVKQDGSVVEYDMRSPYPGIGKELSLFGTSGFRPNIPAVWKIMEDGVPWQKYLARRLRQLSANSASEHLQAIASTSEQYATILAQLPPSKEINALRGIFSNTIAKNVRIGRYEVFIEPAGLFRKTLKQKHAAFISNAVCFLDAVFHDPRRSRKIYRGRILYEGREISFDLPVLIFDRSPTDAVRSVILKTGLPEPIFRCKDRFYHNAVLAFSRLQGK